MKTNLYLLCARLAAATALAGLAGCATDGGSVATIVPVGMKSSMAGSNHSNSGIEGYLKVYSATDEFNDGNLMYYPHSRYSIYSTDGQRYKWVDNHVAQNDETPQVVSLPSGNYYIVARSEMNGIVKVPVVIRGGHTTIINLEHGKTGDPDAQSTHASTFPAGQFARLQATS